ncbi:hypothetical protein [Aurantivibrio infirmus]
MNERFTKITYLLRREFWEHIGGVFWTPVILAGVAVFFMTCSYFLYSYEIGVSASDSGEYFESAQEPEQVIDFSSGTIVISDRLFPNSESSSLSHSNIIRASVFAIFFGFQVVAFFVIVFYLLSCLFVDRKDRSILFWKSLPIREGESALVKFSFAIFLIPLIAFLVSLALQYATAIALSLSAAGVGDNSFFEIFSDIDFVNLISVSCLFILYCAFKALPLYAWLMFASAWAKRSPFLVAVIPPLAIIALESLIFRTTYFVSFLADLIFVMGLDENEINISSMDSGLLRDGVSRIVDAFLNTSPVLMMVSLAATAGFLSAAVWLRNNRYEI